MSIGSRIRARRLALNLSQAELAGKEISRAYISQIESGKKTPSHDTLQLIASRLQTSLESLTKESADTSIECLLEEAQAYLDAKKFQECLTTIKCSDALLCSDKTLCGRIKILLGQALLALNRAQEALAYFEGSIHLFHPTSDRELFVTATFELANACLKLENFRNSILNYRKVIKYTSKRKRLLHFNARAYIYLGVSLYRCGNYEEAAAAYLQGFKEAETIHEVTIQIDALIGLGVVYAQLQSLNDAIKVTEQARAMSRNSDEYMWTAIHHNLAIFFGKLGLTAKARRMLTTCQNWYREHDNILGQVSILEEIAHLLFENAEYDAAQCELSNALKLLNTHENHILSGRIYRLMANIYLTKGECELAHHYRRLAIGYFKLTGANAEIEAMLDETEQEGDRKLL